MPHNNHPSLILEQSDFQDQNFSKIFVDKMKFPSKKLPQGFWLKDNEFSVCGYYLLFSEKLTEEQIFLLCKNRNWTKLSQIVGDFWLLCVDFKTKQIFVIVDQNTKFSTFFAIENNRFIISTKFSNVFKEITIKHLDLDASFDFVTNFRFLSMDEKTTVKEIKQLCPGTLLTVNPDLSWEIESLVDLNQFFSAKQEKFDSIDKFTEEFLERLKNYTEERLDAIESFPVASDISSGFDSSLISFCLSRLIPRGFTAYCWQSEAIDKQDTNPELVTKFGQKHDIPIKFFNIDGKYSFSDFDIDWTSKNLYPGNHAADVMYNYNTTIARNQPTALFQGHGGDEIYGSPDIEKELRFMIQSAYFLTHKTLRVNNVDKLLFTQNGLDFWFDEKRFASRRYFPSTISTSVAYLYPAFFDIFWETNTWPLSPFADPRLVLFARSLPVNDDKTSATKREIWKNRKDIFLEEQFGEGGHMDSFFNEFIRTKKNIIIPLLKNSCLSRVGYFRGEEIARELEKGHDAPYLQAGVSGLLESFLHLELFIQKNNLVL